jgi:dTDP-4-amino-4,6-dideoxy-D-galactose acyltransferase
MNAGEEPCEFLDWDSHFWGFRIGRVRGARLSPGAIERIEAWCAEHGIRCLYFLGDANDLETARLAEGAGFRLVDTRMAYARFLADDDLKGTDVRVADESDIPELRRIAGTSYRSTRFYVDLCFPRQLCDELYATWIETSCRGYAQAVLVAEGSRGVEGYISCHLEPGATLGSIGLVGVDAAARGRGVAQRLVRNACGWFKSAGALRVKVVTQARNIEAQRVYQRSGFLVEDVGLWFHRWTMTG